MQCGEGLRSCSALPVGQSFGPGVGNPMAWSGNVAAQPVDAVGGPVASLKNLIESYTLPQVEI